MILSDKDILKLCTYPNTKNTTWKPMIDPFVPHQVKIRMIEQQVQKQIDGGNGFTYETKFTEQKVVSYGLSSAGYDVRLERQFKIFTNAKVFTDTVSTCVDPLNMKDDYYIDHEGDFCIIPPNGYILGLTVETFNIPRDVMVVCVGKSTLARIGCIVNVTPIEPGWCGKVVIEVANASNVPVKVHAGMGIGQFLFHRMTSECDVSYEDRGGKYQGQSSLITAKV